MQKIVKTMLSVLVTSVALSSAAATAQQNPMRVILPVGPGSGVDGFARTAQAALSKELGQPVVIENMPGAGGVTGTAALVKSAPNGNTIAFVSNNHVVNPLVYKNLPFDSLKDITPISVIGSSPFVLVVNPSKIQAKTAKELQALLKSKPDQFNYASSGNGTILHLAGEMFMQNADVKVRHIPYKGVGPMLNDIIAGQVEMGVTVLSSVQGHLKNGTLRAIGVMGKDRVAAFPDIPTMAEQGFPGVDISGWFGVIGPANLPKDQIQRINSAVVKAFNDQEVKEKLVKQDNVINPTSAAVAAKFFKSEQDRYADLIKKSGLKVD